MEWNRAPLIAGAGCSTPSRVSFPSEQGLLGLVRVQWQARGPWTLRRSSVPRCFEKSILRPRGRPIQALTMVPRIDPKVIEVEAEHEPRPGDGDPGNKARGTFLRGASGPVLAGLLIDLADLVTPMGLGRLGYPIGAAVGWWVGGQMGLSSQRRLWLVALGALYCGLPGTSRLPLGTIVGFASRLGKISSAVSGSQG